MNNLLNGASVPLIFLGGIPGVAARGLAGVGLPMGVFKFSRDFESEADIAPTRYLAPCRHADGVTPVIFLKARLKAASDS